MTWREVFVADNRVRSGWRFVIAVVMVVAAQYGAAIFLGIIGVEERQQRVLLMWSCVLLPLLLAIFKMLTSVFENKPLGSVGIAFHGRWGAELGNGLALGALMVFAVAALELGLGAARFSRHAIAVGQLMEGGGYYGALFAVAAANEELMFRGYPFQRLVEAVGPAGAVGISSALFGFAHLGNPSHTWLSTLNTAMVGVPLAVAYLRTRALWLPIGIHFAWNLCLGYVFGFHLSGIDVTTTLLNANVYGPAWVTGGAYGPEGSVLATLVIAAATVYLLRSRRIYISGDTRELALAANAAPPGAPRDALR